MVEFELKFRIKNLPIVLANYDLVEEKTGEDLYYDTVDYLLIKGGNFLRIRNNKRLDFKLNIGDDLHLCCKETSFDLDDISSKNDNFLCVLRTLGIEIKKSFDNFESFIKENDFKLMAPIIKKRKIYKIDENLEVSIDEAKDIGMFLEAEMMFDDSFDHKSKLVLKDELIKILKEKGIIDNNFEAVNVGYVELYLMENNKEVYEMGKYKI